MATAKIFDDLKADHDRHREVLSAIADAKGDKKTRAGLFEKFRIDVSGHAAAEEQSLYATMMMDPEMQDDARHSVSEHKEVDDMLTELYQQEVDTPEWSRKFTQMRTRYDHHITEEEEEMFPKAAEHLSDADEVRLAKVFEKRKPAESQKAAETNPTEKEEKE
ncbi:hemerythrin domain-containing protein [Sphingomonas paeninsulae]|uniref:Hemerythrin domain-containing protein n=1 Tax=Sphingomonas paeninsulae TaxID=2319844 RepID=A0A494THE9_SPHPE|nr:hemerythrin domain-containing protein [Sphingomonas paeninsulae]AYJ86742.1 hemerythrin domain-containing protein [Sphingomonas paeninsulae]